MMWVLLTVTCGTAAVAMLLLLLSARRALVAAHVKLKDKESAIQALSDVNTELQTALLSIKLRQTDRLITDIFAEPIIVSRGSRITH